MIELSKYEKEWIRTCKGHNVEKYPLKGKWVLTLKPLFEEIYGWNPDMDYNSYLNVLFSRLLEIQLKISDDQSGSNRQMRDIFDGAFRNGAFRKGLLGGDDDLPIERAISVLCGLIMCNTVIEKDGTVRYVLD